MGENNSSEYVDNNSYGDDELSEKTEDEIEVDENTENKQPHHYSIIMHNDNYTTMEFVVEVLMEIFHKAREEAIGLMLHIHQRGRVVIGKYPKEIAETKIKLAIDKAKAQEYPLKITMEKI